MGAIEFKTEADAMDTWRLHPDVYRRPVKLADGTWYLPLTTSGFAGPPGDIRGVWAGTRQEAWALYEMLAGHVGYPIQVGARWLLPRPVGVIDPDLAAEAAALRETSGPVAAPPSPGSSAAAAKLTPADKRRISARIQERSERVQSMAPDPVAAQQATFSW